MMTSRARYTLAVLLAALALAACKDPSKDKPAAVVSTPRAATEEPAAKAAPKGESTQEELALTAEHGKIGFIGSKVTGSHEGVFQKFSGKLRLNPTDPGLTSVEVEIEMSSVKTDAAKLDKHLQTDHFFNVPKFPKATFKSTKISVATAKEATHTIEGNLTLRGVTKGVSFPAKASVTDRSVTVKSEFKINSKDFGVSYPGRKDDLIRDHVVIKLDFTIPRG